MIERSDTDNPLSLRGVGPYDPSGSEAAMQNLKFPSEGLPSHNLPGIGHPDRGYRLSAGVQVREESFGLLFYNYRGPRLYFVPTKDLIDVDFFNGRQGVGGLIASICARNGWSSAAVAKRITQILAKLEDKGLIYGQSIR